MSIISYLMLLASFPLNSICIELASLSLFWRRIVACSDFYNSEVYIFSEKSILLQKVSPKIKKSMDFFRPKKFTNVYLIKVWDNNRQEIVGQRL